MVTTQFNLPTYHLVRLVKVPSSSAVKAFTIVVAVKHQFIPGFMAKHLFIHLLLTVLVESFHFTYQSFQNQSFRQESSN